MIDEVFRIGSTQLRYRCTLYRTGLRLELDSDRGDRLRATLRVRAPVALHLEEEIVERDPVCPFRRWERYALHASFQAPYASRTGYIGNGDELFGRVLLFVYRAAGPACTRSRAERERLRDSLAHAVRAAVARCDPEAFAIARRFHPLARFFVYRQLLDDASGRIRQLASACPGALILAAGLESRGGIAGEAARDLVREVVAGRKLALVLSDAAQGLLVDRAALEERMVGRGYAPGPALTLFDASSDEFGLWLDRMRLFVRRAGPRVSSLDLCGMPPPRFAPEDIPRDPRLNGEWYGVVRLAADCVEQEIPARAWSFLSRNAAALYAVAVARTDPDDGDTRDNGIALVRHALAYSDATGRWPGRSTSAKAWLSRVEAWWNERALPAEPADPTGPADRLGWLLEKLRGLDLGDVEAIQPLKDDLEWDETAGPRFPAFDMPTTEIPGVDLRPILTALELAAEGRRMGNCVATRCGDLARGGRWIFSGYVQQEPATIGLSGSAGHYTLLEARGFKNGELSASARSALLRWVQALNREGAGGQGRAPRSS